MSALIARRQLLGTIFIAPIVALPSPPDVAAIGWKALRAAYETARDTGLSYYENVFEPEQERILSYVGPQPPLSFEHVARDGHTATFAVVPTARSPFNMAQLDRLHDDAAEEWNAWNVRRAETKHDPRWQRIQARMDDLFDAERVARSRLMAEPASDASALAFKLQLALGDFELDESERLSLLTDANRLS